MATLHLVYPHRRRISAPHAIGRKLGGLLAERFDVVHHDLLASARMRPGPDDVLLGHPVASPLSCFVRNAKRGGWRRVVMMYPFNGHARDMAFLGRILPHCDRFLAITGNYWFERARTDFPTWFPWMSHLDLAVDRLDFPRVKETFNPPGKRRFLYVGNLARAKNVGYLSQIASAARAIEFAWFGGGGSIPGVRSLGYADFSNPAERERIAEYDFLITVGANDANPTTILEAMAWGLLPVCTPQSGYTSVPGITNVPLDDVPATLDVLTRLQSATNQELLELQTRNFELLDERFSWHRVRDDVVTAIDAPRTERLRVSLAERTLRAVDECRSDGFWLRPSQLRQVARQTAGSGLRKLGLLPEVT
ncbi:MAG: hypothetical protein R3B13_23000 [Polyangiaceae bacterium]